MVEGLVELYAYCPYQELLLASRITTNPYDLLPMVIENLQDMEWVLPLYTLSDDERGEHFKRIVDGLRQEYQNKQDRVLDKD